MRFDVRVVFPDELIQVRTDEVLSRRCARVTKKSRPYSRYKLKKWKVIRSSAGPKSPIRSGEPYRARFTHPTLYRFGHLPAIFFCFVCAEPVLIVTFTASSIGSLNGTSIRSRPCS